MKNPRIVSVVMMGLLLAAAVPATAAEKKVLVGFREQAGLTSFEKQEKIHRAGGRIKRALKRGNVVAAHLPEEEILRLKNDPAVAYVEEDSVVRAVEPFTALGAPSQEYLDSWGVSRIGADLAAQAGFTGAGIKVAVLDTGIDYNHPDLKDNYRGGYNFVYDNDDPFDDSMSAYVPTGHGTHVAGIIGARNNGTGVVGVAPDVSLYAVKVLNAGLAGDVSDVIAGIEWAINNKVQIISMSIGSSLYSEALREACDRAAQAGIILVAAAGNFNSSAIEYPAAFDSVIAVTATRPDDTRPLYNYGPQMELAAPGVGIKSTVPGGGYGYLTGTSQAAPHVAGVAALLLASGITDANGNGTVADEVRQRLASTARDLGEPGWDASFGYGLVDAARALGVSAEPQPSAPVFTSTPITAAKEGVAYSYAAAAADADGDSITYSLVTAPAGMVIDPVSGLVSWTPTYRQAGSHGVTIRAADGGGLAAEQSFTVTVEDDVKRGKVVRTKGAAKGDKVVVPLERGSYTIEMTNFGLKTVEVESGRNPRKLGFFDLFIFRHGIPQVLEFEYDADVPTVLIFTPHGKPGTFADISVFRNS
uniref:Subtilisin n=1 Tax=Geobacter metallireducens TaxID=28232 RepID=A0A831U1J1_GEOME